MMEGDDNETCAVCFQMHRPDEINCNDFVKDARKGGELQEREMDELAMCKIKGLGFVFVQEGFGSVCVWRGMGEGYLVGEDRW